MQQEQCYMLVCQSKGCAPDEQMLQLLLVTHINREQMATQVAGERERVGTSERGSHKADMIEIDVFANNRIGLKTHRRNLHSHFIWTQCGLNVIYFSLGDCDRTETEEREVLPNKQT